MRRRSRLMLTLAGVTLLGLGFGGFVVGPFISAKVPVTTSARFPLGDPESVDADAAGRVYVADGFYHRVQRFSAAGDFEVGWHINAVGPFRLRAAPDATIEVAVAKARSVFVYSSDGAFLERRQLDVAFEQFASATGPRYSLRGPLSLRPGVFQVSTGKRLISDSLPLALVRGPFPAWGIFMAGIVLLMATQRRRRSGRAH